MIKICFLIHDLGQGGAEKVLVNLVNNMDPNIFDITVIALFGGGVNEQFLKSDIKFRVVWSKAFPGNSRIMKLLSPEALHRICIKDRYDIEVAYLEGPSTRVVGGCTDPNTKLIAWFHSMPCSIDDIASSYRGVSEVNRIYQKFDKVVSVSQTMNKKIKELLQIESKALVIYNTVESERIRCEALEDSVEIKNSSAIKLIATGTLKPIKGFERLLRIVKRLILEGFDIEMYLLGKGPQYDQFEHYIIENNINDRIALLGYQINPYKYLSKCDLFVCSSISEGFSTAVTEALIVGIPVITTNVSGMAEMLGEYDEYGVIVENDEEALYNGIKMLISDPEKLSYYKKKSAERGYLFDKQVTVKLVEDLLIDVNNG